jgi:hypothetical protein
MSTKGLSDRTADTRVLLPKDVYEAAKRVAERQLLSYSNWAARLVWREVMQDQYERVRIKKGGSNLTPDAPNKT